MKERYRILMDPLALMPHREKQTEHAKRRKKFHEHHLFEHFDKIVTGFVALDLAIRFFESMFKGGPHA